MKNGTVVPQKGKNGITIQSSNSTYGFIPQRTEIGVLKRDLYSKVRAALFMTAKGRKEPKCPSTSKWIERICISYNGLLFNLKNKGTFDTCWNMDDPRGHYAE